MENKKKPKVSVIVPVYNVQNYLAECLNSILTQTLKDIEIICVNDGSTDQSASILKYYAHKDARIKLIEKANKGYGHTINMGIQNATGKYIGIVESDDYIHPQMYKSLFIKAEKYQLDFIKSDFNYFMGDKGRRVSERVMTCPRLSWYNRVWNPSKEPKLLEANLMNVTGIYSLDFLRRCNIRLNETPGASFQDTGFWFQVFLFAQRMMFLPRSYYYIRRDNPCSSIWNPDQIFKVSNEYRYAHEQLLRYPERYALFSPYLFKQKISAYLFSFSNISSENKIKFMPCLISEIMEAERRQEIRKDLFDSGTLKFIDEIKNWEENKKIPYYSPSSFAWKRLYDCIKGNGINYTIKHFMIKCKLIKKVF